MLVRCFVFAAVGVIILTVDPVNLVIKIMTWLNFVINFLSEKLFGVKVFRKRVSTDMVLSATRKVFTRLLVMILLIALLLPTVTVYNTPTSMYAQMNTL